MALESLPQRLDSAASSQAESPTASTSLSDSSRLPRTSILKTSTPKSSATSGTVNRIRFNIPLPIRTSEGVYLSTSQPSSPSVHDLTTTLFAMSSVSPVAKENEDVNRQSSSPELKSPTIPTTPTEEKSPNVEERAKKMEDFITKTLLAPAITEAFQALKNNRKGKYTFHREYEIKTAVTNLQIAVKEGGEEQVKEEEKNIFRSLGSLEKAENIMHDIWEKKLLEKCQEAVRELIETML